LEIWVRWDVRGAASYEHVAAFEGVGHGRLNAVVKTSGSEAI
jgi:hypothetical protein